MTEIEWNESKDPTGMVEFLRGKASKRKLRLFSCACCRLLWDWLEPSGCRAIEVAEEFADGLARPEQLTLAAQEADRTELEIAQNTEGGDPDAPLHAAMAARAVASEQGQAWDEAAAALAAIERDEVYRNNPVDYRDDAALNKRGLAMIQAWTEATARRDSFSVTCSATSPVKVPVVSLNWLPA